MRAEAPCRGMQSDALEQTLTRLKTLLVVSDARANHSAVDARIALSEASSSSQKLRSARHDMDSRSHPHKTMYKQLQA